MGEIPKLDAIFRSVSFFFPLWHLFPEGLFSRELCHWERFPINVSDLRKILGNAGFSFCIVALRKRASNEEWYRSGPPGLFVRERWQESPNLLLILKLSCTARNLWNKKPYKLTHSWKKYWWISQTDYTAFSLDAPNDTWERNLISILSQLPQTISLFLLFFLPFFDRKLTLPVASGKAKPPALLLIISNFFFLLRSPPVYGKQTDGH